MGNLLSGVFYIICFGLSYILYKTADKYKNTNRLMANVVKMMAILIPVVLAAFRYNVGTDFRNYNFAITYERNHGWNYFSYPARVKLEIGFWFVVKVAATLFQSNVAVWFVLYLIMFFFLERGFAFYAQTQKYSVEIGYFIFLIYYYSSSLNITRQIIALSIIYYASRFVFENKKRFFVFVILATLFHYTAIISMVMWVLWDHKNNRPQRKQVMIVIDSVLMIFFLTYKWIYKLLCRIPFLDFLRRYEYALFNNPGKNRTYIVTVFISLLIIMLWKRLVRLNEKNEFCLQMVLFNLIIGYGALSNKIIFRLSLYFEIFYLILFPQIPYLFTKNSRNVARVGIALYWLIYFIGVYVIIGNGEIVPYKSIWR